MSTSSRSTSIPSAEARGAALRHKTISRAIIRFISKGCPWTAVRSNHFLRNKLKLSFTREKAAVSQEQRSMSKTLRVWNAHIGLEADTQPKSSNDCSADKADLCRCGTIRRSDEGAVTCCTPLCSVTSRKRSLATGYLAEIQTGRSLRFDRATAMRTNLSFAARRHSKIG